MMQVGSWLSKLPVAGDDQRSAPASTSHPMLFNQAHSLYDGPASSFGGSGSENDLISSMTRDMALM